MTEKRKRARRRPVPDVVAATIAEAEAQSRASEPGSGAANPLDAFAADAPEIAESPGTPDEAVTLWCAGLDHSDTDNAARMIAHFGRDMLVVEQARQRAPLWAVWDGRRWDADTGNPRAFAVAQQVGRRIGAEAPLIRPTDAQQAVLDAAKEIAEKDQDKLTAGDKATMDQAARIKERLSKRREARIKHAVTSKNKGRIEAMLACASPHLMRDPDDFNADMLAFVTNGHSIRFEEFTRLEWINPDDPDTAREIEVKDARLLVHPGHMRADLITQLVPVDYDPEARCPRWDNFLSSMLPDAKVRRMVQVASGLGLIGRTVQRLFFHYGAGANGKSVYMETLTRLLGETAVTLPATSFTGEGGGSGQASPDVVRLYGRRLLRVKELPEGEDLRENFVKEATGGEALTARDLFAGYFDFRPLFVAHMSGNGFPRITGTDEGIWRRMAVVHWPVQVPEKERRDFEEMIAFFEPEYPGILNWLIEGVLIYLREGLEIPEAVREATAEYRTEMDPTADFCSGCVDADAAGAVQAKDFYEAYTRFVTDQQGKHGRPISLTRFGKIMKRKYAISAEDKRHTVYRVRLSNVPDPYDASARFPDGYAG